MTDTPSDAVTPSPDLVGMETDDTRRILLHDIAMKIAQKFVGVSFNDAQNVHSGDGIHDYSRHFLTVGCLYAEMRDAIREGAGKRVTMLAISITTFS